jgi:hypothetical protein
MAYMNSWSNIVGPIYPKNGTSDVAVDIVISVTFIVDMIEDSVQPSGIVLFDESNTKIPVDVVYLNKVATVTPRVALDPGTRYKLLVCSGASGVRTVAGQILGTDYNINFTTANAVPPGKVTLLAPVDRSIFNGLTEFRWQLVPSITNYEIQISNESTFGSLLYSSAITGDSVIPDIDFEHDETYYWRVRAVSNSTTPLTGSWSDTWQFRYLLSAQGAVSPPGSTPATLLDVISVIPGAEAMFVSDLTSITVEFSADIDPLTVNENTFIVEVDYLDGAGEPKMATGQFDVIGNVVVFNFGQQSTTPTTPSTPVVTTPIIGVGGELSVTRNTMIMVNLTRGIKTTDGSPLIDDIQWMFSTVLTPYYSRISDIRDELRTATASVTDFQIAKQILRVSQWADQIAALPYGSQNEDYLGETQQETNNCIFFHNYVRYETALRILHDQTLERMQIQGGMKQIGDLIIKDGIYISPDYIQTVKRIEELRNKYQHYLTLGKNTYPLPRSVVKGETNYPYPLTKRNSF